LPLARRAAGSATALVGLLGVQSLRGTGEAER